jgi:hypothetical protein
MSIPAMIVFHFDSALELMTDGVAHGLFDPDDMEDLLEGCVTEANGTSGNRRQCGRL